MVGYVAGRLGASSAPAWKLEISSWLPIRTECSSKRKTPSDMAICIGSNRERFERELKRARYRGRFVVVVEGALSDVAVAARGIHHNAVLGYDRLVDAKILSFRFCR